MSQDQEAHSDFEIPDMPSPAQTDKNLAGEEALGFASGDLESYIKEQDAQRKNKLNDHVHMGTVCLFWLVVGIAGALILSVVFHLVVPAKWHYLSSEQINSIKALLTGGIVANLMTLMFEKKIR